MCSNPFLCLSWGVVVGELREFAVDTELLLKAASAFINCCVVRESKVSSYDAHLPLLTKSCVPCAHLPNIKESDRSSVLVLLLHYTNCPVLTLI